MFADLVAGLGFANSATARAKAPARRLESDRARLGEVHRLLQSRLRLAVQWLRQRGGLRDPAFPDDAVDLSRADRQRRLAAGDDTARVYSRPGPRLCDRVGAIAGRSLAGANHRDRS